MGRAGGWQHQGDHCDTAEGGFTVAMLQPGGTGFSHRGDRQNVDQQPAAPGGQGHVRGPGAGAGQGLDGIHGGADLPGNGQALA